jgi:hypothetical protein
MCFLIGGIEMEKIRVTRDGERDLSFNGVELANVEDRILSNGRDQNRWTEMHLFKTAAGKYVLARVRRTIWQGEEDHYSGSVFNKPDELPALFEGEDGILTDLVKELVHDAAEQDEVFKDLLVETIA